MRPNPRQLIYLAVGVAAAVVLAPLPVAAGISLSAGTDVLTDALPGARTESASDSPEPAPPTSAEDVSAAEDAQATDEAPLNGTTASDPVAPQSDEDPAPPGPVSAEVITNGPRDKAEVAITLDADLSQHTLARIEAGSLPPQVNTSTLDYLESTGTPATVFVTGLWAQQYPDTMTRLAANPQYELANHSWDHAAWTNDCYGLPTVEGDPAAQVLDTAEVIKGFTGTYPAFFRFPGLCHEQANVDFVASLGERTVDYDLDGSDAFADNPSAVAESLLSQVQNGSIVVLHLNGAPNAPYTTEILAELVPGLKSRGLQPVTMTDLMK